MKAKCLRCGHVMEEDEEFAVLKCEKCGGTYIQELEPEDE